MVAEPGVWVEVDGKLIPDYDAKIVSFEEGDVLTGLVVRVDRDEILVDVGYKSEGVIPLSELSIRRNIDPSEEVALGDEVDALVLTKEDNEGRLILSKKRARFEKAWRRIEEAAESGEAVEGLVIEVVKGGLIIDLGVRGFLPASLVDIRRVQDLDEFLGQPLRCRVIELNRSRNNVVLSRRAVLEEERREVRQRILDTLDVGLVVDGQISNIVDFGAFVDLDGIDGLIHISELSWSHVTHPSEILEIGQKRARQGARHRPRAPAHLARPQADADRSVAAGARPLPPGRRRARPRHEGRHVRRIRRDRPGRRGPRAHLRARRASRRESARGRAERPGRARQDHRDRRRAAPPLALDQARRGGGRGAAAARARGRADSAARSGRADETPRRSAEATRSPRTAPRRRRGAPPRRRRGAGRARPLPRSAAAEEAPRRGGRRRGCAVDPSSHRSPRRRREEAVAAEPEAAAGGRSRRSASPTRSSPTRRPPPRRRRSRGERRRTSAEVEAEAPVPDAE